MPPDHKGRARRFLSDTGVLRIVVCLLVGLLGSLTMVVLTPPFQVPDEPQHFARAFQLSQGQLWAQTDGRSVGGVLPASLDALTVRLTGSGIANRERGGRPRPVAVRAAFDLPLAPADTRFIAFPGSAFYAPFAYLPQAAAIAIGRALSLGPLALLYAARMANALVAVALLAGAVAIAPGAAKGAVMAAGLLPMTLYEDASASADAQVIGSSLLFTALALRASRRGGWRPVELAAAVLAGIVFSSLKPVYLPLLLIGLVPGLLQPKRQWATIRAHAMLVCAVGLVCLAWMHSTRLSFSLPHPGVDLRGQVTSIAADPLGYVAVLARTLADRWVAYLLSTVGVFGWLTVVPSGFVYLGAATAAVVLSTERRAAPDGSRLAAAWQLALVAGCALLVFTALYLIWTPVGAPLVAGVQGRYFIPLVAPLGAALLALRPRSLAVTPAAVSVLGCTGLWLAEVALSDLAIANAFPVL